MSNPESLRSPRPSGVTASPLLPLQRSKTQNAPIYRQIYQALRSAIQTGRLRQGDRLPSTRGLAKDLGVSRTSILLAFDELRAEGLVVGKVGSGTRITQLPSPFSPGRSRSAGPRENLHLAAGSPASTRAFRLGLPGLDLFPAALWGQLASRRWRAAPPAILDYADSAGYFPLRKTIAEYLARTRGIGCSPDQVFIVSGSQQGLDLIARAMAAPRDAIWLEDPGYHGAYEAFASAGATVVPVPVDDQGFCLTDAMLTAPDARFAYVTPSNQFPLSAVLSSERRDALLRWAVDQEGWIIEDDYDCEFRRLQDRLPAMAGSSAGDRVFYVGTFSKTVFPALRLGYLVIPSRLIERFRSVRQMIDRQSSTIYQAIMTDFMWEGHYDRHLRRMGRAYVRRGEALCHAIRAELGDFLEVTPPAGGTHLVAWLPDGVADRDASGAAAARGIEALPLSFFSRRPSTRGALVLGYGGLKEGEIRDAVVLLRHALTSAHPSLSAAGF